MLLPFEIGLAVVRSESSIREYPACAARITSAWTDNSSRRPDRKPLIWLIERMRVPQKRP